jgi:hypothetical protein
VRNRRPPAPPRAGEQLTITTKEIIAMATSKVTPIGSRTGGTPVYRAIADQVITQSTKQAFNEYFRIVAKQYPKGNSGLAVKAFIAALRADLEWYERAEAQRDADSAKHKEART